MKKLSSIFFAFILIVSFFTGCQSSNKNNNSSSQAPTATSTPAQEETTTNTNLLIPEFTDYLENQTKVDENLIAESKKDHPFEEPFVVVNPYGNSPLTAIVIFSTPQKTGVKLVVKGRKDTKDNIETFFSEKQTTHIIPVYGLYEGMQTEVVFTLDDEETHTVMISTDSLSSKVTAKVTMNNEAAYDYSKLTFAGTTESDYGPLAFDSKGDIRWALQHKNAIPIKRLKNGNVIIASADFIELPYYYTGIYEMDLNGKIYHDYLVPGGMHHAIFELSNGNFLIGSNRSDFSTVEDYILEIDRNTGEVLYELDLKDILDTSDGGSINRSDHDWFHNNAIWYDEKTDTILLSGRHVDAIVAVDKTKKKLKWILGNPDGWTKVNSKYFFTPEGDNFEWQYAQHEVTLLPNGDIMMFDNGAGRTKVGKENKKTTGKKVYSRAVIYRIDTKNMTIKQIWEYGKERKSEWYSSYISGAQYLGENNIWITSGGILYNVEEKSYDSDPTMQLAKGIERQSHIDQVVNGELAFELFLNCNTFRSYRFPMYMEGQKFDLETKGTRLGNLGKSPTIENTSIDPANAKPVDFTLTVSQTPAKVSIIGSWKTTSEDAAFILYKEDGSYTTYPIEQPKNITDDMESMNFNEWVSPIGLEGSTYHLYFFNDGVTYDTKYQITF